MTYYAVTEQSIATRQLIYCANSPEEAEQLWQDGADPIEYTDYEIMDGYEILSIDRVN